LKLSVKLLRSIDARREATGDQAIGSAVERAILDHELAELVLEWMTNPESPRVPNLSQNPTKPQRWWQLAKNMLGIETAPLEALGRLCQIAKRDTGQSRRVANFLLAWHNAEENGGWDPTDLWNVDTAIAEDMLTLLKLAKDSHRYPGDLGFEPEIKVIWRLWRSERTP
jgi:hypothetical protein